MGKFEDAVLARKRLQAEYDLRRAEWRAAGKAAFSTSDNSPQRKAYKAAEIKYRAAGEALRKAVLP